MAYIDIDIVLSEGETIDEAARTVLDDFDMSGRLRYTVVAERGTGGGWPTVRVEGERDDVADFEDAWDRAAQD